MPQPLKDAFLRVNPDPEKLRTMHDKDADRMRFSQEHYFKSPEEMWTLFRGLPEAAENTLRVAERCNLTLEKGEILLPHFAVPGGRTTEDYFREVAEAEVARWAPGEELVMRERMRALTFDVICRAVFGVTEPAQLVSTARNAVERGETMIVIPEEHAPLEGPGLSGEFRAPPSRISLKFRPRYIRSGGQNRGGGVMVVTVDKLARAIEKRLGLPAADAASIIGAAVLYVLSVGSVRGFAFFLGLSTLLDVVVAWFFTRPLVAILARSRFFTEARWVGVARGLGVERAAPAVAAGGGR